MFAGNRTADAQHHIVQLIKEAVDTSHLFKVAFVSQASRVQVAVSSVTKGANTQLMLKLEALDLGKGVG